MADPSHQAPPGKPPAPRIPLSDLTPEEDGPTLAYASPLVAIPDKELPTLLKKPLTYRTLISLALPSFIEQVINSIIAMTDTWVAGHGADEATNASASAAVGTMTYLQWFCGLMIGAVGIGATAIVSRSIGAGRVRLAQRIAGTAIPAAFLMGAALGVFLFVFAPQVVSAFRLEGQAHRFGVEYLRIMSLTICFQSVGQIGFACLRGAGDLVRPMVVAGVIMVVNLITVPALAYGWFGLPAMGVRGNAIGTLIAYLIAGVVTLAILFSGKSKLTLRRRHVRIVPHLLSRIFRISLPSWGENMLLWGGQLLIVNYVNKANDAALAKIYQMPIDKISGLTMSTHSTVLRVEMFCFLPGFGIGMATAAIVGQALGAKRPDLARQATALSTRLAVFFMTLMALPMVFLPAVMTRVMVDNSHAVEIGFWPMVLAGLAQPGFAVAIIMASALKGAGDTMATMISTIVGMFIVRLPIVFGVYWWFVSAGRPGLGLTAVWIAIFVDLNFRAVYNTWVFKRGKWEKKKV